MHAGDKVWTDSGRDALAAYAMGKVHIFEYWLKSTE